MKTRVEIVNAQINQKGTGLVEEYKRELGQKPFSALELKAQDGKGQDIEQLVIDSLANETVQIAQTVINNFQLAHDAWVRREMLERPSDSLKIDL